jgi:hypothetical protein
MNKLSDKLQKLANSFEDVDNELLVLADEDGDDRVLSVISEAVVAMASILKTAKDFIDHSEQKRVEINSDDLEKLVAIAGEFDDSGDPELVRQASVIDQLLNDFAYKRAAQSQEEIELEKLQNKHKDERREQLYSGIKDNLHKQIEADEAVKKIQDQVKEYRPLEHPLSTRTCPDHFGTMMARVSDDVYQCPLDHKVYNWRDGFTTMKGEKVPGTSVDQQTQGLTDSVRQQTTSFETREQKIGERV